MFLVSFLFDKLGYMPKFSIDVNHPFPCTQKEYVAPEFEKPIKQMAKKTAKKTVKKKT